jgi:hypothetical protein
MTIHEYSEPEAVDRYKYNYEYLITVQCNKIKRPDFKLHPNFSDKYSETPTDKNFNSCIHDVEIRNNIISLIEMIC